VAPEINGESRQQMTAASIVSDKKIAFHTWVSSAKGPILRRIVALVFVIEEGLFRLFLDTVILPFRKIAGCFTDVCPDFSQKTHARLNEEVILLDPLFFVYV
jgi:hypothetical protein